MAARMEYSAKINCAAKWIVGIIIVIANSAGELPFCYEDKTVV